MLASSWVIVYFKKFFKDVRRAQFMLLVNMFMFNKSM